MARTDDDSWDITESVGATALGVAWARSQEATSELPAVHRPLCQRVRRCGDRPRLAAAAGAHGRADPRRFPATPASRTKWFDEFFIAAGAGGIEQAVILAAGLDARAWRLPWNDGSAVYEIDQPKVLAFKTETLRAMVPNRRPGMSRCPSIFDTIGRRRCVMRDSIRPSRPHGRPRDCCPTYPPMAKICCSSASHELSAAGSRVAVESFGAGFFDPEYLASRRERIRQMREAGRCRRRRQPGRPGPVVHRGSKGSQPTG